jgi:hypothetical protein
MLRHPTIPATAFPSALDPGNAIRSFYKTNLLYPAVGPGVSSGYVMRMSDVILHLAIADSVINRVRDFHKAYGEVPKLPTQAVALDPRIRNPSGYVERFVATARQHSLLEATGQINRELRQAAGMSPAFAVGVKGGRVAKKKARSFEPIGFAGSPVKLGAADSRSLDTALLMRAFAVPNFVFNDMFTAGMLQAAGPVVTAEALLKSTDKAHSVIVMALGKKSDQGASDKEATAVLPLARMALRRVARFRGGDLLATFDESAPFRTALGRYLIGRLTNWIDIPDPNWPSPGGLIFPGGDVDTQREWAFQRSEELRLALGTPVLRGPVGATPVSPRSRHTETQTESSISREVATSSTSRRSRTAETHQVISASTFSQALDNLTESGIADAASFGQESTLLSSLNEERRAVVDTVAREISAGAESGHASITETTLGRSLEYWTEGKDPTLATTELAFQVVVPAQATVRLRDVGLAWCPRVPLPFAPLRANVRAHQAEQEAEYITQYYVPLPVEPPIITELVATEKFEFWIHGDKNVNKTPFSHTVTLYDGAFIDLSAITVTHRNGGWDDAEELPGVGAIPYNWDDLENATPYLENMSLSADGMTVSGTGVLETHDPEMLNISWLCVSMPLRSYSAATVAALAKFEAAKLEKDLKLKAVYSRARQYAKMKADELVDQYSSTIDVRREAFRALIRRICLDVPPPQHSYFEEVLSRCIDWNAATMANESEDMADLSFRDLAPDHFMNAPGTRFFLPIQKGAEALFFETLRKTGHDYFADSVRDIRDQLKEYRDQITAWTAADAKQLVLDEFKTEIVIGHHLEAVVSETGFANGP